MSKLKESIKPIIEECVNPFTHKDFEVRVRKVSKGKLSTGEQNAYDVECKPFTKVYELNSNKVEMILNLSHDALKLYVAIIYDIETTCDYVYMYPPTYLRKLNFRDKKRLEMAIFELCKIGIISPMAEPYKNIYWINPSIIFNGSRINKFPDHVKYV